MGSMKIQREERRQSLIRAATQVMSERGVAESRLADIAKLAGISAGQVLYYFDSKSDLFVKALNLVEKTLRDDVYAAIKTMNSIAERWRYLLEAAAPTGPGDFRLLLWLEAWALSPRDEDIAEQLERVEDQWQAMLLSVLEPGLISGEIQCEDLKSFICKFSAMLDGLTIQVVAGSSRLNRDQLLRICWQVSQKELGLKLST